MMLKKRISLFVATFLIIGFFFLALPEKGYSGIPSMPGVPPCCGIPSINECSGGEDALSTCQTQVCMDNPGLCVFDEDAICVAGDEIGTGSCVSPQPTSVPTLSGWGLMSLAVVLGILGIAGFMVMRRRKVTA